MEVHRKFAQRATESRFTFPEASGLLERPHGTIRRWSVGNRRSHGSSPHFDEPLIEIDGDDVLPLSFLNLLELRFLATYREEASLQAIRRALAFAGAELGVERPLLEVQFAAHGRELFLRFAKSEGRDYFVNASRGGQMTAWTPDTRDFLESLEYDENEGTAFQWWPLGKQRPVVLDTRSNGGRPATAKTGVLTAAVRTRSNQGWPSEDIAADLGATPKEVRAALDFEHVA